MNDLDRGRHHRHRDQMDDSGMRHHHHIGILGPIPRRKDNSGMIRHHMIRRHENGC